jgi:ABC-type multidrug transport system ATPase subunit
MIAARDIRKHYGRRPVLQGASITVRPGELVVLAGENGSGKTTLLHVLVGLRRPDVGEVLWKNQLLAGAGRRAWRRARAEWGFLPQRVMFPPAATVDSLLRFHARLRSTDVEAARRWLERVGLEDAGKERVGALSGGMQQRLAIALTVFFGPELIVMDEPASSLDPNWRQALKTWIEEQAGRGTAVLITSQIEETWGPNTRYCRCESGRVIEESIDRGCTE